jgi:hypothetical protein
LKGQRRLKQELEQFDFDNVAELVTEAQKWLAEGTTKWARKEKNRQFVLPIPIPIDDDEDAIAEEGVDEAHGVGNKEFSTATTCTWKWSVNGNMYVCLNPKLNRPEGKGEDGEGKFCGFHTPSCVRCNISMEEEGSKDAAPKYACAEALCVKCYAEMKPGGLKKPPKYFAPLQIPGVSVKSLHDTLMQVNLVLQSSAAPKVTLAPVSSKCTWSDFHPETGRRFVCTNEGSRHPKTKASLGFCPFHLTNCIKQSSVSMCSKITLPNQYGLCTSHYTSRFESKAPDLGTRWEIPGVVDKKDHMLKLKEADPHAGEEEPAHRHCLAPRPFRLPSPPPPKEYFWIWKKLISVPLFAEMVWYTDHYLLDTHSRLVTYLQGRVRGYLCRKRTMAAFNVARFVTRLTAAETIQKYMRRRIGVVHAKQEARDVQKACLYLQRVCRGILCRRYLYEEWSADKMASWWRSCLAKAQIRAMKARLKVMRALEMEEKRKLREQEMLVAILRRKNVAKFIQRLLRRKNEEYLLKTDTNDCGAALRIQVFWKVHVRICKMRWNYFRNATTIQAKVRGMFARAWVHEKITHADWASRLLQRWGRGWLGRKASARLRKMWDQYWEYLNTDMLRLMREEKTATVAAEHAAKTMTAAQKFNVLLKQRRVKLELEVDEIDSALNAKQQEWKGMNPRAMFRRKTAVEKELRELQKADNNAHTKADEAQTAPRERKCFESDVKFREQRKLYHVLLLKSNYSSLKKYHSLDWRLMPPPLSFIDQSEARRRILVKDVQGKRADRRPGSPLQFKELQLDARGKRAKQVPRHRQKGQQLLPTYTPKEHYKRAKPKPWNAMGITMEQATLPVGKIIPVRYKGVENGSVVLAKVKAVRRKGKDNIELEILPDPGNSHQKVGHANGLSVFRDSRARMDQRLSPAELQTYRVNERLQNRTMDGVVPRTESKLPHRTPTPTSAKISTAAAPTSRYDDSDGSGGGHGGAGTELRLVATANRDKRVVEELGSILKNSVPVGERERQSHKELRDGFAITEPVCRRTKDGRKIAPSMDAQSIYLGLLFDLKGRTDMIPPPSTSSATTRPRGSNAQGLIDAPSHVFIEYVFSNLVIFERHWKKLVLDIRNGTINHALPLDPARRAQLVRTLRPAPQKAAQFEARLRGLGFHDRASEKTGADNGSASKKNNSAAAAAAPTSKVENTLYRFILTIHIIFGTFPYSLPLLFLYPSYQPCHKTPPFPFSHLLSQ